MYFLPSCDCGESKGETTTMVPSLPRRWSNANGRTALIKDFPLPVGRLTKTSFPCKNFFAACNCCSRRSWYPTLRAACNIDSIGPSPDIAKCKLRLSISYRIPSTNYAHYVNLNLDVNFRRQKSGTLEQKCSTIFPDPPVVVFIL